MCLFAVGLGVGTNYIHSHWLCISSTPAVASADPKQTQAVALAGATNIKLPGQMTLLATELLLTTSSVGKAEASACMVTSCSYGLSYLSASTNSRCSSSATLRSATAYHLHQTPWRVLCEKAEATFDRLLLVRGGQNRACDSHPQEV